MTNKSTEINASDYTERNRKRLLFLLLTVVALAYTLFNYKSWLRLDPAVNTGGWITFVSDRGGHADIWVIDAEGKLKQVTDDEADDQTPIWLPNGKRIVFVSSRLNEVLSKQVYQLYSMRPDGSNVRGITIGGGAKLSPEADKAGKRILHLAQGLVTTVNIGDYHAEQLLPPADQPQSMEDWRRLFGSDFGFTQAHWCLANENLILAQLPPDQANALLLAYISPDREYTVPSIVAVANHLNYAWSPVEPMFIVAFYDPRPPQDVIPDSNAPSIEVKSGILMCKLDMSKLQVGSKNMLPAPLNVAMTSMPDNFTIADPAFSPDGNKIAYVTAKVRKDGTLERTGIAIVSSAVFETSTESSMLPDVAIKGKVYNPRWSPDGSKLAYIMMNDNGKRDIWICDLNTGEQRNLTGGVGDNADPSWSPQLK